MAQISTVACSPLVAAVMVVDLVVLWCRESWGLLERVRSGDSTHLLAYFTVSLHCTRQYRVTVYSIHCPPVNQTPTLTTNWEHTLLLQGGNIECGGPEVGWLVRSLSIYPALITKLNKTLTLALEIFIRYILSLGCNNNNNNNNNNKRPIFCFEYKAGRKASRWDWKLEIWRETTAGLPCPPSPAVSY